MSLVKLFAEEVKKNLSLAGDGKAAPIDKFELFTLEFPVVQWKTQEGERKGKGAQFHIKTEKLNIDIALLVMSRVSKSHFYLYVDKHPLEGICEDNHASSIVLAQRGNYLIIEDNNDYKGWVKSQKEELWDDCNKLKYTTVAADNLVSVYELRCAEGQLEWTDEIYTEFLKRVLGYALVKGHYHPRHPFRIPGW